MYNRCIIIIIIIIIFIYIYIYTQNAVLVGLLGSVLLERGWESRDVYSYGTDQGLFLPLPASKFVAYRFDSRPLSERLAISRNYKHPWGRVGDETSDWTRYLRRIRVGHEPFVCVAVGTTM